MLNPDRAGWSALLRTAFAGTGSHRRGAPPVGVAHGRLSQVAVFGLVGLSLLIASGTLTRAIPVAHSSAVAVPAVAVAGARSNPIVSPGLLLVWTSTRLADGLAGGVAGLAGVSSAVPVVGATVWLTRSQTAAGAAIDVAPVGTAIPLDLRAADLSSYATLVPIGDRSSFTRLRPDEVLLGATSAQLRRLGPGATLTVGGTRLRVAGVVPDAEVGSAEVFTAAATAASLGVTTARYLLVQPGANAIGAEVAAGIRALLGPAVKVGTAPAGQILGPDDSVLPQVLEKQYFGEFSVHLPLGSDGSMDPNPGWTSTHLQTATVPILGRVNCNAAILPALRSALGELAAQGLSRLVNPNDYGGCFVSRLVAGRSTDDISHHAWGSAIDLNVSANPLGGASHQDPRLVETFRHWGFTWGGDWLAPDPMHFELQAPVGATGALG